MKQLFSLVFTLIFLFSSSTSGQDQGSVICQYSGQLGPHDYQFCLSDIVERCDIILYSYYLLDFDVTVDSHVIEADKNILRYLVENQKTVYIFLDFVYEQNSWENFLTSSDQDQEFCNGMIRPLIEFLKEFSISGIILDAGDLYTENNIGFDCKLNTFAGNIKKDVSNLKVGMLINGYSYKNFPTDNIFNFEITNENIDLYIIDMSPPVACDAGIKQTGLFPIMSNDPNVVSIEEISCAVQQSCMEKSKIYARLYIGPIQPSGSNTPAVLTSYTKFCINSAVSDSWCADDSQTLYDKGQFVKSSGYYGLMLTFLETDDYEGACGCGEFPVANLIIDGWECKDIKICMKL